MTYQPKDLAKIATQSKILQGQRALVIGIANENSIAYGCAAFSGNSGRISL